MSRRPLAVAIVLSAVLIACTSGQDSRPTSTDADTSTTAPSTAPNTDPTRPDASQLELSGGLGTVFNTGSNAFAQGMPTLDRLEGRAFAVGNSFFNENWVTAPASTEGRDGLGPMFNAQSCSSCHFKDGRGAPPLDADDPSRGLLLRLSVPGPDGDPIPVENYGSQLQDRAINGVDPEGRIVITTTEVNGSFADGEPYTLLAPSYSIEDLAYGPMPADVMISPRVAPAVFGMGLLEAVPESDIRAAADPDDVDGDGVSGRANEVVTPDGDTVLGRFGWKANAAGVREQSAAAFVGDLGITSSLHPAQDCTAAQLACLEAIDGGHPEIDDHKLERVTFYTRTLAVPARRDVDDPVNVDGERLFAAIGCSSCHTPELRTGPSDITALADQTIRPYTDLLLHDMGEGLADGRPDFLASGVEWRTAPLWGIGLVETVNRHTRFMHDGRARNLTEAVLWHGGEAAAARERFRTLSAAQRDALVAFLESL